MNAHDLAHEATLDWGSSEAALLGGRYEVLGFLGSGGMGSVYRVRDTLLDEVVALKMVRGALSEPGELERFRSEVKLARRVTHRNVARAFDVGEHGSERFLTMELVEGESLAHQLEQSGPLPAERAIAIARELAEGLRAAHAAGVVHRDLKPGNVLLERGGRVVITDFGIARALDAAEPTGGFVGTPAYMAPEQVLGRGDVGPAADVYALGAVLYELLTGEPAWEGESALATATAKLHAPPPDPRVRAPRTPAALSALVLRCMATRPELRPANGAAALQELAALHEPSRASAVSLGAKPLRQRVAHVAPVPLERRRVAVLPVRVAPVDDLLAEELTEDLADRLSMTGNVRVRPAAAVRAAANAQADARAVGQALEVEVVVEATLRRREDAATLSARAIETSDGFLLWGQRFEGAPGEVFSMLDKVAHAVGAALSVDVGAGERKPLADPRALEQYVAARQALRAAWMGLLPLGPVVAQFDSALALAPDDPLVLSGAAMARARAVNFDPSASDTWVTEADALAERALRLAPDAGEPWLALATLRHREGAWAAAVTALRHALRRAPALPKAQELLGAIQAEVAAPDEAIARFEAALSTDPASHSARVELARLHGLEGRWDQAARALGAPPDDPTSRVSYTWLASRLNLWRTLSFLEVPALPPESRISLGVRAYTQALEGRFSVPAELFERWAAEARRGSRFRAFLLQGGCEVACAASELDKAHELLLAASRECLFDLAWLERCPLLAPLRDDARFHAARAMVLGRVEPVREALVAPLCLTD